MELLLVVSNISDLAATAVILFQFRNKVNVFDLGSFLIKPVQRFLKYPLLIEELLKLTDASTPTQPTDHDKLILVSKMMQSLAKEINEDKRKVDLGKEFASILLLCFCYIATAVCFVHARLSC